MTMRLAPGTPLNASLIFDEASDPLPTARLALANRVAQLEWSADVITSRLPVAGWLYPSEAGLQPARSAAFEGLHGFIADSLPEGWGYHVMRRRLARLDVRIEDLSPLDRLAIVGRQGRGALCYTPENTPPPEVESFDLDTLCADAAKLLAGDEAELTETLATLAGGSGGARPKVHLGFDGAGHFSISDTGTHPGHDAWIVKFAALSDPIDIGPIECAYAAMAQAAGLVMTEFRLLPSKTGPGYFATQRFDRPAPGRRLHMASLSGIIEATWQTPTSYDNLFRATSAITRNASDVEATFRRMVFNILAYNRDDHSRQHSFLMDEKGDWKSSPSYDLTYSTGPGGEHYLDIEGEGRRPTLAHVTALGKRHSLSKKQISEIIEQIRGAVDQWPQLAKEWGVGKNSTQDILAAHQDVKSYFG